MSDPLRPDLRPEVRDALLEAMTEATDAEPEFGRSRDIVLLNILETARLLELDRNAVYRLSKAGLLRTYRIRGTLTFNLEDVRRFDRTTRIPSKHRNRSTRKGLSPRTRFRVLERDGFRCRYCGSTPQNARLVVDHVRSLADGGSDDDTNLVIACEECNQGKGRRSLTVVV